MNVNPANPMNLPGELPIARYRFGIRLESGLKLPEYAGSTLRGVFGHALRRATCMTRQPECGGCPLLQSCPYSRIFANPPSEILPCSQRQSPPQPYIIEAGEQGRCDYQAGADYHFDMVLIGRARKQLPLITYAFSQAFARGVGRQRGRGVLQSVSVETPQGWEQIYSDGHILPHTDTILLPDEYPSEYIMHIRTPMRLQQHGSVLGIHRINADVLLRQLMRRVSAISTQYWQMPLQVDFARLSRQAAVPSRHVLKWHDWSRYSNRQQSQMTLGGVIGTWHFKELPLEYSQLLYVGQWLHIGKETVFGLGRYTLENVKK